MYHYAISNENKESTEFSIVHGPWGGSLGMAGCSAISLDPRYMEQFSNEIQEIEKVHVPQRTLNSIIESELNIEYIDILKIDVEGGELNVLKGIDLSKYQPLVILIEDIFNDKEIHDYLTERGYVLDQVVSYNKYYLMRSSLSL